MSSLPIDSPQHPVSAFAAWLHDRLDELASSPLWSMSPAQKRAGLVALARAEARLAGEAPMLTLTENASSIVNEITAQIEGEDAGLRITAEPGTEGAFGISTSDQPAPGDQVVEQAGAKVYVDSAAAAELDDKVLVAGVDESGNVQFALGTQA